jgi:glutathione S-transferase
MTIYHIAFRTDWAEAVAAGEYRVSSRDLSLAEQGFIHASTAAQVAGVANAFYADAAAEDLVLLVIDPELLIAPLRYDPVPGAEQPFPHIYGPLNTDAVTGTAELARDAAGRYVFEA